MRIGNLHIGRIKNEAPKGGKKRISDKLKTYKSERVKMAMDVLKTAVDDATDPENCNRTNIYNLYNNTRKDGHVKSQYKVALNKLLSEPFVIMLNGTESAEKIELFQQTWFERFLNIVLDVEFNGYTLCEFGYADEDLGFTYVKAIDRMYINPYKKLVLFEPGGNEGIVYDKLLDSLFIIELGDVNNIGEFESVTREVIWKNFARSDWAEYNERFGKPLLDIACNTDDDDEVAAKIDMAKNFGSNSFIVRDLDDKVNMISPQGSANGSQFEPKAEFCNKEISKMMNGQTGTSDEKAFVGGAEVHERILDDFTKGRLRNAKNIVNDKLIPFLIKKGWHLQGCKLQFPILLEKSNTEKTEDPDNTTPVKKVENLKKKSLGQWPDWLLTMPE